MAKINNLAIPGGGGGGGGPDPLSPSLDPPMKFQVMLQYYSSTSLLNSAVFNITQPCNGSQNDYFAICLV